MAVDKGYKLDNEKNFLFRGSQKGERYWRQAGSVQKLRSKGATGIHRLWGEASWAGQAELERMESK